MGFSNVKQNDPRWSYYPFGDGGETYASSACGLFAVSIILGLTEINDILDVYVYMKNHGFVTDHSGTYQCGIYKTLTEYGVQTVQTTSASIGTMTGTEEMSNAMQHVMSGGTLVLLMGSANCGTALTNNWTSGGHYISVVGYDSSRGFLVHDPAGRNDGYHAWSEFDGDVKHIFQTEKSWNNSTVTTEEVKLPIYKQLPQIRIGSDGMAVLLLEEILKVRGYYKGGLDRSFGQMLDEALKKYQTDRGLEVDGICGVHTWYDILGGL